MLQVKGIRDDQNGCERDLVFPIPCSSWNGGTVVTGRVTGHWLCPADKLNSTKWENSDPANPKSLNAQPDLS